MRHLEFEHSRDRLAVAELTGVCERIGVGDWRVLPDNEALEVVRAVTADPQVLGHVLGSYLIRAAEHAAFARVVALLRQAGADEAVAEQVAAWHRWKQSRVNQSGIIL